MWASARERVVVVGAGIVGLAVARALAQAGREVIVLEKEASVATHQSGHNSGVVHAGIYYPPGSLKATLCRRGGRLLKEYCLDRGLEYREIGKLIVARDDSELEKLAVLEQRAHANRVPGVRRLDQAAMREVEPHVAGVAAVYSPSTAIVDFAAVCTAYGGNDYCDAWGCWGVEPKFRVQVSSANRECCWSLRCVEMRLVLCLAVGFVICVAGSLV